MLLCISLAMLFLLVCVCLHVAMLPRIGRWMWLKSLKGAVMLVCNMCLCSAELDRFHAALAIEHEPRRSPTVATLLLLFS